MLKISAGTIKGIKTHLFGKHKDSKYTEQYIRVEEGKSKQANTKITNYYTHSSGKLSVMDKNVINYITCCNIPFLTINHPTFKKLVRNTSDKLLDESHYRKNVLPEIYKIVKNKIKMEVKELEYVCFTSDLWIADTTKDAFISLTATGVTATFTRKNYTLAIQKFSGTHTAEKIAEILTDLLDKWGLKSHCFLTDSGANIVKALEMMHVNRMSCAAHDLNLCVKTCIGKEKDELAQLFEKCRKIVGTLKHSSKLMDQLKDIQLELGLPKEKLLQEVSTRWNSSLKMIERIIDQEEAINEFLVRNRRIELIFSQEIFSQEMKNLLKPMEEVSTLLCKSLLSARIPSARTLISNISKMDLTVEINGVRRSLNEIEEMRARLIEAIRKRFLENENRLLIMSTFLDPRFKNCFSDDRNIYFAKVSRYLREEVNEEIQFEFLEEPSSPCHKQPRSFLEMMDDTACSSKQVVSSERKGIDYELREYEEGDRAQMSLDPLHWCLCLWILCFAILAPLARRYLSAPCTSVSSEQMFSVARDVFNYRRSILSPQTAEMLIFLHNSIPDLNYDY